ncbi:MAG TPA: histidine kinase [Jatrophihabitans sp.]|nr:histidine kinase [Jatrophihabitans sp.]
MKIVGTSTSVLIDLQEQGKSRLLARLGQRWEALPPSISSHDVAREQFIQHATVIWDLLMRAVVEGSHARNPLVGEISRDRAQQRISPNDSMIAAEILHDTILDTARDLLPTDAAGFRALHQVSAACMAIFMDTLRVAADEHVGALLEEVTDSHASERRRISRELHDQTGHGLAVAQRQLELVRLLLARPTGTSAEADAAAETALATVVETMRGVHDLIAGLRQDEDIETLSQAIARYLQTSRSRAEVAVNLAIDEHRLSAPVRREVFLMVREALRNAQRHARAELIQLDVKETASGLTISVIDDGIGMRDEVRAGNGMKSLRERAALLGGQADWVHRSGGGTAVVMTVPLAQ